MKFSKRLWFSFSISALLVAPLITNANENIDAPSHSYQLHHAKIESLEKKISIHSQYSDSLSTLTRSILTSSNLKQSEKEHLLLQLARKIGSLSSLDSYQFKDAHKSLMEISQLTPELTYHFNEGGHIQKIVQFPFNQVAKNSINRLTALRNSAILLQRLESQTLSVDSADKLFVSNKNFHLIGYKNIRNSLTPEQAEYFYTIIQSSQVISSEVILLSAIDSNKTSLVLNTLKQHHDIPLQHYLATILTNENTAKFTTTFESLSQINPYASMVQSYLEKVPLTQQQKINLWTNQLSSQISGTTAAQMLAKHLDINSLVQIKSQLPKVANSTEMKNRLLILILAKNTEAKLMLKELVKDKTLPVNLLKEAEKWIQ